MNTIPFKYFVEIKSSTVKSTFSVGRLNALCITKPALTLGRFLEFGSSDAVLSQYGVTSAEYAYALKYFSYTSKAATGPKKITFCNAYDGATSATLYTGVIKDLQPLKAIEKGSFQISMNGELCEVKDLNFTNAVSFGDVCTSIVEGLKVATVVETQAVTTNDAFLNAKCSYNAELSQVVIVAGDSGYTSTISELSAGTVDTDISAILQGTLKLGAKIVNGDDALPMQKLITSIDEYNGDYYTISSNFELKEDADIEALAKMVSASDGRYMAVVNFRSKQAVLAGDFFAKYNGFDGFFGNYYKNESINALTQAFVASVDYFTTNGNQNMNFIPSSTYEVTVDNSQALTNLGNNRLNSIYSVGGFGQAQTLYGEGKIFGDKFKNAVVYIANSFLILQLQINNLNNFISSSFLGVRDVNSQNAIIGISTGVLSNAINAGIIIAGANLTSVEEQKVIELTGDNMAPTQIKTYGYILQIEEPTDDDINNNRLRVKLIYMSNTPLNRLVISNFILGA